MGWNKHRKHGIRRSIPGLFIMSLKDVLYENTLYVKSIDPRDILIVCLYVDNLIFTDNNSKLISESREAMIRCFEMTDLGLMSYFLGIEVN